MRDERPPMNRRPARPQRPQYPDLLGEPSPALLRLNKSRSVEEVDGFIAKWQAEVDMLRARHRTPDQERLLERLNALILRGKSKRRMLRQREMG